MNNRDGLRSQASRVYIAVELIRNTESWTTEYLQFTNNDWNLTTALNDAAFEWRLVPPF